MFAGHFPAQPVVPGAWLLAQAIQSLENEAGASFGWQTVVSAKFHATVRPGASLDLSLDGNASSGLELKVLQGGEPVATVRFGAIPG